MNVGFQVTLIPNSKNSRNSYIELLERNLSRKFSEHLTLEYIKRVRHYNWLESVLSKDSTFSFWISIIRIRLQLCFFRSKGFKNVLTVHNIVPHDFKFQGRLIVFEYFVLSQLDGFVFLNSESRSLYFATFPSLKEKRTVVISHGDYRQLIEVERFSTFKTVHGTENLLIFGQIRPYKNVESIIDNYCVDTNKNFKLSIMGLPNYNFEYFNKLTNLKELNTDFSFIQEKDLVQNILESKAVFLPYKYILNSGSVFLALSLNTHVFIHEDLVLYGLDREIEKGYIIRYSNYEDLKRKFSRLRKIDEPFDLTLHNWDIIISELEKFYQFV